MPAYFVDDHVQISGVSQPWVALAAWAIIAFMGKKFALYAITLTVGLCLAGCTSQTIDNSAACESFGDLLDQALAQSPEAHQGNEFCTIFD